MWTVNDDCPHTLVSLLVLSEGDGTALTLQDGKSGINHGVQEVLPRETALRLLTGRREHVMEYRRVVVLDGNGVAKLITSCD